MDSFYPAQEAGEWSDTMCKDDALLIKMGMAWPATALNNSSPSTDNSNDDDEPPVEMSFYLYVEAPPPPVLSVRKSSAKPPPPKTTDLGPYPLPLHDFLQIIANGCRTKTANLPLSSMKWKFDRPGNAQNKPLSNPIAFTVMIKSLKGRHKDYVFSVYMPPPTHPCKARVDFKYNMDELTAPSGSVLSIRQQIASIDQASNKELN
ncbi:hypothetical protein B0H14DRAFT_2578587 [Mycena olivaceomarginata]|nr:hypothetical protein B0H14DRAFT_2578587 [Mycena olivaceomarginata]